MEAQKRGLAAFVNFELDSKQKITITGGDKKKPKDKDTPIDDDMTPVINQPNGDGLGGDGMIPPPPPPPETAGY